MDINKFLAPHSAEARAHTHVTSVPFTGHYFIVVSPKKIYRENDADWDTAGPTIDETVVAHCASYRSFEVRHVLRAQGTADQPDVVCEAVPLWRTPLHSAPNETRTREHTVRCLQFFPAGCVFISLSRRRYSTDAIHNAIAKRYAFIILVHIVPTNFQQPQSARGRGIFSGNLCLPHRLSDNLTVA